jgi:hypothetical protein
VLDKAFELPEPRHFAAMLDIVLQVRAKEHMATDVSRNVNFFESVYEHSERYADFRNAAVGTIALGAEQNKLEEAVEVVICHCIQVGWQAAKHEMEIGGGNS